jgi:hypothetical protein
MLKYSIKYEESDKFILLYDKTASSGAETQYVCQNKVATSYNIH